MLKATERAQGKRTDFNFVPNGNEVPTLADLHIDRKVSMLAQQIAELPMEKKELKIGEAGERQ